VRGEDESATVKGSDLKTLLGPPTFTPEPREEGMARAGIANGLAWTAAGGEILDVEVAVIPGSGKIQLTGTLGEVMKESAFAAVTYARSRARILGLSPQFHEEVDIHIHIPEGATPKDGPSAGITIAVALISALTEIPTRSDVAMTGEITLRGRVLGVGGLKEKAVAAHQGGIKRILLPASNAGELERLPQEVLDGVEFLLVQNMDEVLDGALVTLPASRPDPSSQELMEGAQNPGIQLSQ
jgi:ATP-dependent Lon protease